MPMKRAKRRILFGLNRQVAKGLSVVQNTTNNNNTAVTTPPPYPCHIVNRFECPYDYDDDERKRKGYNNNNSEEVVYQTSHIGRLCLNQPSLVSF